MPDKADRPGEEFYRLFHLSAPWSLDWPHDRWYLTSESLPCPPPGRHVCLAARRPRTSWNGVVAPGGDRHTQAQ